MGVLLNRFTWTGRFALVVAGALALGACSMDSDTFSNLSVTKLLPKPPDFSEKQSWGTLSVSDAPKLAASKPVMPEDLISSDGRCATPSARAEAAPTNVNANANVGGMAGDLASASAAAPAVSGGIALGMTECEVALRSGQPEKVDISTDTHAERVAVLTYDRGVHPGIYRFTAGRLTSMEAVEVPAPEPKAKKPAKKRAKPKQPQQAS